VIVFYEARRNMNTLKPLTSNDFTWLYLKIFIKRLRDIFQ